MRISVDESRLEKLAYFVGWALVVYLYIRFWDAFAMTYTYEPGRTEGLRILTKGPLAFNFWVLEFLFGMLIPIIILLYKPFRNKPVLRMVALAMVVGGVIVYRWDVNIAGQLVLLTYLPNDITARYTTYIPSLIEVLSGAGVVAYGLLALTLGIRYLKVVDHSAPHESEQELVLEPATGD